MGRQYEYILDSPAMFSIVVCGTLDRGLSDRLGGLSINHVRDMDGAAITTLVGQLPDQSALFGVLNTLHNMAVPLLAVRRLPIKLVSVRQ